MEPSMKPYGNKEVYDYVNRSYNQKKQNENHKIQVVADGTVTAKPDQAVINLGVVVEDEKAQKAQQQNALISKQVIEGLKSMGIQEDEIQTSTYSIDQMYDYHEGRRTFRGYQVKHMFKVIINDISKVGLVIDVATQNGANTINNVAFTVSNPEMYYKEALKKAIIIAKNKAEEIAKTLKVNTNITPVWIIEKGASMEPNLMREALSATTPIQEGEMNITSSIEAIFTY